MINTVRPQRPFSKLDFAGVSCTIALLLILAVNFLFLQYAAFRGFNFFDYGNAIDAGWRVFRGQRPYVDFIYGMGPLHLYVNHLFFLLFGFGKTALLTSLLCLSSFTVIATYFATLRKIPLSLTALSACLAAVGSCWGFPHPWYDHTAYLCGILAVWLLCGTLPFSGRKQASIVGFLCGFASALSFMTKTNIGAAFALTFFVALLFSNENSVSLLAFVLGNVVGLIAVVPFIPSFPAFIDNTFPTFGAARSQELQRLLSYKGWMKNGYWIPLVVVAFAGRPHGKEWRGLYVLFLGTALSAIFNINTGSLRGAGYLPLMGVIVGMGFLLVDMQRSFLREKQREVVYWFSMLILLVFTAAQIGLSAYLAFERAIPLIKGPNSAIGEIKAKPFDGWKMNEIDRQLLDEMVDYIRENVPKDESLLILGDLQILYALTERDSYKGVPYAFHTGYLPAPGRQVEQVRNHVLTHLPIWLITYREEKYPLNSLVAYLQLTKEILGSYRVVKAWGVYALLKQRGT